MKLFAIGALGLIGIFIRFYASSLSINSHGQYPSATFIVNCLGCVIAGLIFAIIQIKGSHYFYQAILIGFCGGLTTFSGYNLEFLNQMNKGLYSKALAYFILGPITGFFLLSISYFTILKLVKA